MISGEVDVFESLTVAECQRFEIGIDQIVAAGDVDRVLVVADRIIDWFGPRLVIELELKPAVVVDCSKDIISDVDGDVEVNKGMLVVLCMNKPKYIRMVNAHHSHIGAATHAALLYDVGYLIDDVHE